MDRKIFYDRIRNSLFSGNLTPGQVDGIEAILNFWEDPPVQPVGELKTDWDIRTIGWLAYMLATTYHETAQKMQPISEYGSTAYFQENYCNRKDLGNGPQYGGKPGDGPRFHGRGYVQLTGRINYTKVTPVVREFYPSSPDFVADPDAIKSPKYSAIVMFYGMFLGIFTGYALKNFIGDPNKGQKVDFYQARKIINGLDCAELIAGYAENFNQALEDAGVKA
ncbi:hypothetical protein [Roseofilum sp. Guam]|uniref:hypothetical protein n=1 Tax=Roseofilum sp. Guam TaxID=2821502 RepID=UPI001B1E6686|nr:hypothetical protein [Roseofilum sp. Guam]MBP0029157.1 hypothetical protein [Roseofilum sp. Guam]